MIRKSFFMAVIGCMFCGGVFAGDSDHQNEFSNSDFWRHQNKKSHTMIFTAHLRGAQEVTNPPGGVDTERTAHAVVSFDAGFTALRVRVTLNTSDGVVAAHFHCGRAGQNGPVAAGLISPGPLMLENDMIKGMLTNANFTGVDCNPVVGRPVNNVASLALAMRDGLVYLNVHSMDFPAGEIRGQMLSKE